MKHKDSYSFLFLALLFTFFMIPSTRNAYEKAFHFSPELVSFMKFAVLATFGEMVGSRIKTGRYIPSGFGLIPRAVIWGFLGIAISMAFRIFSAGVGNFSVFQGELASIMKMLKAFSISLLMNIFFAPFMMLGHQITDQHIANNDGRFTIRRMKIAFILKTLDWDLFWGFLMKKTIPLFWIPAHTITFLLPEEFRTLFAAMLSVVLGILLSISSFRNKQNSETEKKILIRSA